MTQAERFVRNLCEDARRRVVAQRDAEVTAVAQDVPVTKVPADVRRALAAIRRLQPQMAAATKIVTAAGYHVPSASCACDDDDEQPRRLRRQYQRVDEEKKDTRSRHDQRLQQIQALQNTANVTVLGLTSASAQPILKKLQADLAKV